MDASSRAINEVNLNDEIHGHLLGSGRKSIRIKTNADLARLLSDMKDSNCLVIGSLHSAALVLHTMQGT